MGIGPQQSYCQCFRIKLLSEWRVANVQKNILEETERQSVKDKIKLHSINTKYR